MKRYILTAMTILVMAATNAFADKESNEFLTRVAQKTNISLRINGMTVTCNATYTGKTFTINSLLSDIDESSKPLLPKVFEQITKDNDKLKVEALALENMHNGFINNLINSKATLKYITQVEGTKLRYELQMKPKEIKTINIADTVNLAMMNLEMELRGANAVLPMYMDDGTIINRMFVEKPNLIMEYLIDENTIKPEQIEDMKEMLELLFVNMMKTNGFAKYVEQSTKTGLDFALRLKGSMSGEYTDIVMPLSKAKDIFDPNNPIDTIDAAIATGLILLKKKLPIKHGDRSLVDAKYADKMMTYIYESNVKGAEAEYIQELYRKDKVNLLGLGVNGFSMDDDMKQLIDKGVGMKIKTVYKNPGWNKNIVQERTLDEIVRLSNDQRYKDSLQLEQYVALLKPKYNNGIKEEHSFDGKTYTITLSTSDKRIVPVTMTKNMQQQSFINIIKKDYKILCEILYRMKINVIVRFKNNATRKSSDINIPYTMLAQ